MRDCVLGPEPFESLDPELEKERPASKPIDHFVVLDFEATCDEGTTPDPQEIIEFPSVLVARDGFAVVDTFESFVRPLQHPTLSRFCREFTAITQADVDRANPFRAVLDRHTAWLASHGLLGAEATGSIAFVLCGDWDLGTMLPAQALVCEPPLTTIPAHFRRWVNIKQPFARHAGLKRAPGMAGMLSHLNLTLEGRHHRGIDDCHNIARILTALSEAGVELALTSKVSPSRYPPVTLELRDAGGETREIVLTKRALKTLLGLASESFRRAIQAVSLRSGRPVTDDDALADLEGGETLTVS